MHAFLTLLQRALGHDLPNQLIAVNGLAKLLELEAGHRLGDAREYLERLTVAGLRCHETVKELAEAVRLVDLPPCGEPIALAEVIRDGIEAVRPRVPDLVAEVSFAEDALTARLPAAVLRHVLTQALRIMGRSHIQIVSRSSPRGLILEIRSPQAGLTPGRSPEPLALAGGVLACHGGRLEIESSECLRLWLPGEHA